MRGMSLAGARILAPSGPRRESQTATPSRAYSPAAGHPRYSLVIPVYNEEAVLPVLLLELERLLSVLEGSAEVIFVDDGSGDRSPQILAACVQGNASFRLLRLSRNFGHQAAITAGMDRARGAAVIIMDADLQDPPCVVPELIAKWKEGYDIVYARRAVRERESFFKRTSAWLFYRFMRLVTEVEIPPDVGDFRLVDRCAVEAFQRMGERDRFVRGMFAWMGYRQTAITFTRPERAAGDTKYGLNSMARLAADGLLGFSDAPLRMVLVLGIVVSFLAMLAGVYALTLRLLRDDLVRGWA